MGRDQRLRAQRFARVGHFVVCRKPEEPDVEMPQCSAAEKLAAMLESPKALPRFRAVYGIEKGDCKEVALALMADLIMANESAGWSMVNAGDTTYDHCWLEFDGWAIDASTQTTTAFGGGIVFADAKFYRGKQPPVTRVLSADEVRAGILDGSLYDAPGYIRDVPGPCPRLRLA